MKLNIEEKKVLYAFGCPSFDNTVKRLKYLTSLTVDPEVKHMMLELAKKIDSKEAEGWYRCFYHQLRSEMDSYFRARQYLRLVEKRTKWEEEQYEEAV